VICNCGGIENGHDLGVDGCYREWATEQPRKISCEDDRWMIDGNNITGRSLRNQRGYFYHDAESQWSRFAGGISENSLR